MLIDRFALFIHVVCACLLKELLVPRSVRLNNYYLSFYHPPSLHLYITYSLYFKNILLTYLISYPLLPLSSKKMYTSTPTSKFLVLSPTESGPDSINTTEVPAPEYDTPQSINLASSTSVSSATSNDDVLSTFQNGFLYLGYQTSQSPITSSSTPGSSSWTTPLNTTQRYHMLKFVITTRSNFRVCSKP